MSAAIFPFPVQRPAPLIERACVQLEVACFLKAWTLGTQGAMSIGALAVALDAAAGGDVETAREALNEAQALRNMGL